MNNQLLVEICPSRSDHQGQTKEGHRWDPHVVLLILYQADGSDQVCQWKERDHHAGRRSNLQQLQWEVRNRRVLWIFSRHSRFHICVGIHHKIRTYVEKLEQFKGYLHLRNLSWLVISSENCKSISEADLEADKESDSLHWVVTSIHIVTHEQVVRLRWLASDSEEFLQVVELPVDVTTDCHWGADYRHVGLKD